MTQKEKRSPTVLRVQIFRFRVQDSIVYGLGFQGARVEEDYMEHFPRGKDAVLCRFLVRAPTIGKLGVVAKSGKKDRLIGDSRVSGVSLGRCEPCRAC